ncbi:MAG: flagellar filament capping protein FliD [Planctomycetaceae bacterium]|nr:flagellar filament capping protein FliD [Planctomycetaceae bacterium]
MGRIQSSIGLITGTDIGGTVDQLVALSGRPRDRLVNSTTLLQQEQQSLAELTAAVIGVQLAGQKLANASTFRSKTATSSNSDALSAIAGTKSEAGSYVVRTLQAASTHTVGSLQRLASSESALGYAGTLKIQPSGGFIDDSAALAGLNDGRGVEAGTIRLTDRSGASAEIDLTTVRTINDVMEAINDAEVDIKATTVGDAIRLTDLTGSTASNLKVEQLGDKETAADLGLWGVDSASSTVTGFDLEVPATTLALRGAALSELNGGQGLGSLTNLDITLADGSNASVDLSSATNTAEIVDAIDASGLALIVRVNDAGTGFRVRDVSGGSGNFTISSSDDTAASVGLDASTTDAIITGDNLNRQTVTTSSLLSELNQGNGIDTGSFTITDSAGVVGAVNLKVEGITTVGGLVDAINALSTGVTASLNDAGDGIALVDTAAGSSTLEVVDTGTGTAAADLGIAGTAEVQVVAGASVSALVGTQAAEIEVEATDTLASLAAKINDTGRYATGSVEANDDETFSLRLLSKKGGEDGRFAIETSGFDLDLRTTSTGQDAKISVSADGGPSRILSSSDGVFEVNGGETGAALISSATLLDDIAGGADRGSFTITDSSGAIGAVNLVAEGITTVGGLMDAINGLGIGVQATLNDAATGLALIDTASGSESLVIADTGSGVAASSLGIAGTGTVQTVGGASVTALVGPAESSDATVTSGLSFTLKQVTNDEITIDVQNDASTVVSAAESLVSQYNLLVDKIDSLTFFNADTDEVGLLFGSSETLRIQTGYSRLLSGRIVGAGDLKSIGQVGLGFNDTGKLELSTSKLQDAIENGSQDVEEFFSTSDTGLAAKLDSLAEKLAGGTNGMLLNRSETLTTQIEFNNDRIESLNDRLENERERLLRQYYSMEQAIAKIQSNQQAVSQIAPISIPT